MRKEWTEVRRTVSNLRDTYLCRKLPKVRPPSHGRTGQGFVRLLQVNNDGVDEDVYGLPNPNVYVPYNCSFKMTGDQRNRKGRGK